MSVNEGNNVFLKSAEWEASYGRRENFIFEPKEEVIRFLSRFVRKRVSSTEFIDLLEIPSDRSIKAIDFGCGIGAASIFMASKLGIHATGVDISSRAIDTARTCSKSIGLDPQNCTFSVLVDRKLDYDDCHFDVGISEGVLDSMTFVDARSAMSELARVTSKYIYISLISSHEVGDTTFDGEVIVKHNHEFGTVQSYFTEEKIGRLINGLGFRVKTLQLQLFKNLMVKELADSLSHVSHNLDSKVSEYGRYYVVLERGL